MIRIRFAHAIIITNMSIFEVPNFIAMPAVGIDISTDTVRFIEFKKKGDRYIVGRFDSIKLPSGIVQAGNVEDAIGLSVIIKDLAKKHKLTFANIALPEEQSFLVQMDFPNIKKEDLRTAIEIHLEEYVPISPTECIFDYVIIPSKEENVTSVIVCAFPEKIINQYIQVFADTGITPKTFELQSYSMARAIFPNNLVGDNACMGIDIGKDITNVFIVKNNVVHFSAILDIGGDNISHEIARRLQVSFDEAEELKIKEGLLGTNAEVKIAIQTVLDDMRNQILKYFSYWVSKNETEHAIDDVYLTGGGSNLNGISDYFGQGLRANVLIANPWVNVFDFNEYIPPIDAAMSQRFTAAIGLALKDIK